MFYAGKKETVYNSNGNYLFNFDEKILFDDRNKNQINLYKLKEDIILGNLIKERYIELKDIFEKM